MLGLSYDYDSCVRASEKTAWTIDDVMPADTRLDFARPFLPTALAGRDEHPFLTHGEARTLNQITGNAYLNLFGFVEEYIIATVVQHAGAEVFGDPQAMRALLRFADEEVKHQQLFHRFVEAFRRDCGFEAEVLGAASEVAQVILSKSPMAVMMVTLHLEIMTQAHYVECVRDDQGIDQFFARLLRMHWLEESQHARIDALELDKLLAISDRAAIERAFDDYLGLIDAFDGLLRTQAEMDVRTLARATSRELDQGHTAAIIESQHAGYRRTFLVSGMSNPTFTRHLEAMWDEGARRVREKAVGLS